MKIAITKTLSKYQYNNDITTDIKNIFIKSSFDEVGLDITEY